MGEERRIIDLHEQMERSGPLTGDAVVPDEHDGGLDWVPAAPHATAPALPRAHMLATSLLLLMFAGWSTLIALANWPVIMTGTLAARAGLLSQWAIPVLAIAILWLMLIRGRSVEAIRFGAVADQLAREAESLEARARTVNDELALARDFLDSQGRALAALGHHHVERLTEAGRQMASALGDAQQRAEMLEGVSVTAGANFEHLRRQVPLIVNAGKDLTNQIGAAGRAANAEMQGLIARLADIGTALDDLLPRHGTVAAEAEAALTRVHATSEAAEASLRARMAALAEATEHLMRDFGERLDVTADRVRDRCATAVEDMGLAADAIAERLGTALDETHGEAQRLAVRTQDAFAAAGTSLARVSDEATAEAGVRLNQAAERTRDAFAGLLDHAEARVEMLRAQVASGLEEARQRAEDDGAAISNRLAAARDDVGAALTALDASAQRLSQLNAREVADMHAAANTIDGHASAAAARIVKLADDGSETASRLAFAIEAMSTAVRDLHAMLDAAVPGTERLDGQAAALGERLHAIDRLLVEALPASLAAIRAQSDDQAILTEQLAAHARAVEAAGATARDSAAALTSLIAAQRDALATVGREGDEQLSARTQAIDTIARMAAAGRAEIDSLRQGIDGPLAEAVEAVRAQAATAGESAREAITAGIAAGADDLGQRSAAALRAALDAEVARAQANLTASLAEAGERATAMLRPIDAHVERLDAMLRALEARVADVDERFAHSDDQGFARRMALLTESLNSTAIDVAKILSNDVTDTAWAAYLKGDRGVFTRRAVRLLDTGEARTIAQHYDQDSEFRDHVNRYVHDFEAMMRNLLSTRDGGAIGVTLLSSDVGKLYVALAQAIERLR